MAKASVNFQKSSGHSEAHNFRTETVEPHYLLPVEHRQKNEYWKNEKSAKELFDEELSKANRRGGAIPKFENSHWEAVVNLNANHNLDDAKKVARHIEKKFNITCTAIAIHRDEGHINERGIAQHNYHAHINFMTYKDGRQNWRKEFIKPNNLRELQTDTANLLHMQRGLPREVTGAVSLNHRIYREHIRRTEAQKREVKEQLQGKDSAIEKLKQENERLRAELNNSELYSFREMQKRITALETENTELKKELHRENTAVNKTKDEQQVKELEKKVSKHEISSNQKQLKQEFEFNQKRLNSPKFRYFGWIFKDEKQELKNAQECIREKYRENNKKILEMDEQRKITHNQTETGQISTNGVKEGKIYLEVDFELRKLAKEQGAIFDREKKAWYVTNEEQAKGLKEAIKAAQIAPKPKIDISEKLREFKSSTAEKIRNSTKHRQR